MKAAFKKAIAVAFVAVTAASMLSVGASAADTYTDTATASLKTNAATYSSTNRSYIDGLFDDLVDELGDVKISMKAYNYINGKVEVTVDIPSWVDNYNLTYTWSGNNLHETNEISGSYATCFKDLFTEGSFNATCKVSGTLTGKIRGITINVPISSATLSVKGYVYNNEQAAKENSKGNGVYYDSNLNRQDYWDKDNIYCVNGVYYWYANGRWQSSKYWGDWDWDWDYRPSYSREYEVDWSGDTFEYNGKEQLPTATVTIGNKTIDLDVKLISGNGTDVGRHRVRASLPSRYSRYGYDLTGTNFYYYIEEAVKDGFVTENGNLYYYKNGKKLTGWQTISGDQYYFDANGIAEDGWAQLNTKPGPGGDWYYFNDGKMVTGWISDGGKTYYCYGTGIMCSGRWHKIDNKWYYFNGSGAMVTSQWILDKGKWYYVAGDGVMATNTTVPGGYKVDKNGVWVK